MKASPCSTTRQLKSPFECQHPSAHLSHCPVSCVQVPNLPGHALACPNHTPSGQMIGLQAAPSLDNHGANNL